MSMIETPYAAIESYIARFSNAELPVLKRTKKELAALREHAENLNGRSLAAVVLADPLLTLRVLVYIETHRRSRQNHDITTIERALMMLGIAPFFEAFGDLPTVEDQLAQHPRALLGVLNVIARARQASNWARDWATLRHDLDIDEVTVAALLHDAAEILCWCFAPSLMLHIQELKQTTPGIRSALAQKSVLGFALHDIQLELIKAWHLPELLVTLMDDSKAQMPRVRNVVLATNLARHSAKGWQDPALPDDFRDIADLLHVGQQHLLNRLGVPPEFWPSAGLDEPA